MLRSSEAEAIILLSCVKLTVRMGNCKRLKVRKQARSSTSHRLTNASALPTAKYLEGPRQRNEHVRTQTGRAEVEGKRQAYSPDGENLTQ